MFVVSHQQENLTENASYITFHHAFASATPFLSPNIKIVDRDKIIYDYEHGQLTYRETVQILRLVRFSHKFNFKLGVFLESTIVAGINHISAEQNSSPYRVYQINILLTQYCCVLFNIPNYLYCFHLTVIKIMLYQFDYVFWHSLIRWTPITVCCVTGCTSVFCIAVFAAI